jgi:DNA/RNA-binding domain of Phe-tRNA-synthetase-like protein
MQQPPFDVRGELDGWALFWAELALSPGDDERLAALRRQVCRRARERFDVESLASNPTVAALRKLFRTAGTDPTRYRPSSEALLRRILKGDELPAINPLVDINNCLSVELAVPCCVMAEGTFEPPLLFRAGRPGESYQSLRGPFRLEGKPLLCDTAGPLDCPITGNERVKVAAATRVAWLVAYLPSETAEPASTHETLERLVDTAPLVRVLRTAWSTPRPPTAEP